MFAYIKLLAKDHLLALQPSRNQRAGQSKGKAILSIIGFGLIFVMLYGMIVGLEYFVFQGFVLIKSPEGILATVFLLCTLLTLFISFFYVFHMLFFSKDILFVSALPISSRGLLGAKLSTVLMGEAGIALLICVPAMVLYGIHTDAEVWFYVKTLFFVPFLPVIPIAVVTLLAFVFIRISALWKRREGMTTIATFLLIVGILAGQLSLSSFMAEQGSEQLLLAFLLRNVNMLELIAGFFPPIRWICNVFLTTGAAGWLYGLLFAIASLGVAALIVYGLGGGYQALAVKQSEAVARLNAQGKKGKRDQRSRSPFMAMYLRELKEIFRVPPYASNCLSPLIMFPIMFTVMFLGMGEQAGEMALLMPLLVNASRPLYLAIASAALSLTGSMNIAVFTSVSREGTRHYFSRIIPVAAKTQLLAKLCMGLTLNFLAALLTSGVLCFFLPFFWQETLVALLIAGLFSVMVCTAGLILDTYRPNFHWRSETEAVKRNMNGVLAMFGAMLVLALLIGLFFLLQSLGVAMVWNLVVAAGMLAVIDAFLLLWLTGPASTTYCLQEKFI